MKRVKRRRSDGHNRGIRDVRGDLWEVELGRRADAAGDAGSTDGSYGQVIFCRKPDGFAFRVRIPAGRTLSDYDDEALVEMIDRRLSGGDDGEERRAG